MEKDNPSRLLGFQSFEFALNRESQPREPS
jgi:hypothetical protein